ELRLGTPRDRRGPVSARDGSRRLVGARHAVHVRDRPPPAGPVLQQSTCRGGLPQGTGDGRGTARGSRAAKTGGALRGRAPELLPALLELHVFQSRKDLLSAGRQ